MDTSKAIAAVLAVVLVLSVTAASAVLIRKEYKTMLSLFRTPEQKAMDALFADAEQELKDAQAAEADALKELRKK